MVDLLRKQEAVPATYPDPPDALTSNALALDHNMIWARIEAYVAHRWTAREVIWTVRGPGAWAPDLEPATITTIERFVSAAWEAVSLDAEWNGGVYLEGDFIYRVICTAGGGNVPAPVEEAFRRLAEYWGEAPDRHGAGRYEMQIGELQESFDRTPKWIAQAMQLSGAADLLRPYRRAP